MDKKKEALMNETYRQFIDAGLGLDSSVSLNDIVDDKLMGFGTTIDEKIFNVGDLKDLLTRQKEQSKDIDLRWEIKPLSHYTSADENTAFFADDIFLHATSGGELIEMYLRFSVVLSYVNNQWKVIHWHGSKPENVQSEADTFGIENWKQKAEALEKLVEERTADLLVKNRELEIEASLERVRAVAMGMKKPDDILDICKIMFTELQSLGFPGLRNTLINFWDDAHDLLIDYDYSDYAGGNKAKLAYSSHPVFQQFQKKIKKSKDAFAKLEVKKDELESWKQRRRESGEYDDHRLNNINGLFYYFYSIGVGAIGISTFSSLTREKLNLLKRFRNVFDLAYRRYEDIEKAEAQSKEAQIQLALERVRARTMAMQRSDELMETAAMLFDQLRQLGEHIERTIIGVMNEEERSVDFWATRPDGSQMDKIQKFPIDESIVIQKIYDAWRQQKKSIVIDLQGEELESYFQFLKARGPRLKRESFGERRVENFAFFSQGFLGVINGDSKTPANIALYERFAAVFDQTYTRFLDLQKAEAQAKAAKIELAVERVRAKALAMNNSTQILDVVATLRNEMLGLEIPGVVAATIYLQEDEGYIRMWDLSSVKEMEDGFHVSLDVKFKLEETDPELYIRKVWNNDENYFVEKQEEKDMAITIEWLRQYYPEQAEEVQQFLNTNPWKYLWHPTIQLEHGKMSVDILDTEPPAEMESIMIKMGAAFDLAHKRFVDLQKSETQIRDAQIELALERIRARTMAMRHSDELLDAATLLFRQIETLGAVSWNCSFNIWTEDKKQAIAWNGTKDGFGRPFNTPSSEDVFLEFYEAAQRAEELYIKEMGGKELELHYNYLATLPGVGITLAEFKEAGIALPTFQVFNIAYFAQGYLMFITYQPVPEFADIFKRLAKVFEQTYTRFLDLQKAEAQAREARIETALEKVRSRSLAMHKSDELQEVVNTVFEKLQELNIEMDSATIAIFKDGSRDFDYWVASDFQKRPASFRIPYTGLSLTKDLIAARESGTDYFAKAYSFEEKNEWFNYAFSNTDFKFLTDQRKQFILNAPAVTASIAFSKYTGVQATRYSTKLLSEGEVEILKRFSKVFEQAYVRFLDLQKAEAQAREAQIEAALERVRSRTMGMQKSEELKDIIRVVFEQFLHLNILIEHAGFIVDYKARDDMHIWLADRHDIPTEVTIPYFDSPHWNSFIEAKETGLDFFANHLLFEEKNKFYEGLFKLFPGVPDEAKQYYFNSSGLAISTVLLENVGLYIENFKGIPYTDDENATLMRFGKVFHQTYTRFLDLQKAEAQAKEAKIETALERVRNRTMAMHKSQELLDVIHVVSEQLVRLGFRFDNVSLGINNENYDIDFWMAAKGLSHPLQIHSPYIDNPLVSRVKEARKNNLDFFTDICTPEENRQWIHHTIKNAGKNVFSEPTKQFLLSSPGYARSTALMENINFFIGNYSAMPYSDEENVTFRRFANVIGQSYTRFLDLQKAEAQAREAQIEAALEKVRSRSLAMHKSDELQQVVNTVFEKLQELDIEMDSANIAIFKEGSRDFDYWVASDFQKRAASFYMPYVDLSLTRDLIAARESGTDFAAMAYSFEEKNQWFDYAFKNTDFRFLTGERKKFILAATAITVSIAFSKYTGVQVIRYSTKLLSEKETEILKRFSRVFEQAYVRFLDLQKAEAQAREAQIEASLERVRAKAMAMHDSTDISTATATMFNELTKLGVENMRCGIAILQNHSSMMEVWTATVMNRGHEIQGGGLVDINRHGLWINMYNDWKAGKESFLYHLKGEDLKAYYNALTSTPDYSAPYIKEDPPEHYCYVTYFEDGVIFTFNEQVYSDEQKQILKRFASVFSLTYKRYKDLKKAEAQTRQAKIEAAMEKVRSRAMAMQKPGELVEVAELLRKEMGLLGMEELETSSIYIHHEDTAKTDCWYAIKDVQIPEKELVSDYMTIDLNETSVGKQMLQFYHSDRKRLSISMQGDARKEWINYCAGHSKVLVGFYGDVIPDRTYHLYKFANGFMGAASPGDISPESWDLLQRATTVFSLAYTRFSDLQQAEAQARESKIEAALERVRSRTLAMQKSDELAETAAVLFKQLILLGIAPNRLYINIVKDESGEAEFWITDEDGTRVSSAVDTNMNDNSFFKKMFEGWKEKKKSLILDMRGDELQTYLQHLGSLHVSFKDTASQERRLQYLAYFNKGFIGMASPDEQPEGTMFLLERFAAVFNLTFTRFNDLQLAEAHALHAEEDLIKLKEEKGRTEQALAELQVTQKQLIQSEKMASLGELTAGIAHEIQNPLNFVNNFSEVSAELIAEMNEEITKGNLEDAAAIAADLKQNLEKINHHGKRAGNIVKGMLQHSRSGSSTKEPTDINKLTDEYVRLAYHGLRAKDKTFNATLLTEYDESVGNIDIIPQDIGRVLLNLLTNAFYAVNEKGKAVAGNYQPTVIITTKRSSGEVLITVKDNGNGVPQKVLDKIFQPFFTTKPTGQGTGLGLSLAYDIVKAHGGKLEVETSEGEGTKFYISLPTD